jgi:hypothetical protein
MAPDREPATIRTTGIGHECPAVCGAVLLAMFSTVEIATKMI